MSLSAFLSIARSALVAQQRQMDVISQNIANATTEGYTRQHLPLTASDPLLTANGAIGTGVTFEAAQRMRSGFLDDSYRREAGLGSQYSTTNDLMSGVQNALAEPGVAGLSTSLGAFFDAFSNLANDPNGATTRFLARQAAQNLVQRFHGVSDGLAAAGQNALNQMQDTVSQVNALLAQVTQLNGQIVSARGIGGSPDLADKRDLALDKLASLIGSRTVAYADGSVGVIAGDTLVADGVGHQSFAVAQVGAGYGVTLTGSTTPVGLTGGQLKALTDFSQITLPGIRQQIDQVAAAVVASVNTLHQSGTVTGSTPPVTGVPLFDPAGTTAASIDLSAQIKASPNNLVTGTSGQPGDAGIALQIAQLRDAPNAGLNGQSITDAYAGVVAYVGSLGQSADQSSTAQQALVSNLNTQRAGTDGVNTDEEMVALIKSQQAYSAAARLIAVADQMMQDLIQSI